MVGTTGFEPATSRTPSVRATRLRYVPTVCFAKFLPLPASLVLRNTKDQRQRLCPSCNKDPASEEAGYSKGDIDFLALSAYHSDSKAVNKERSESRRSSKVWRLSRASCGECAPACCAACAADCGADSPPFPSAPASAVSASELPFAASVPFAPSAP